MKKLITVVLLVLFSLSVFAGSVHVTSKRGNGAINVYVVKNWHEADLLVYVTDNLHKAKGKDEIWYFDDKDSFQKAHKVYYVSNFHQADLRIYFVDQFHKAGWKKSNKYQGRLR